jgi:hypothetical protein
MPKNDRNTNVNRREDWGTPLWLFNFLNAVAGFEFAVDLAAREDNALCGFHIGPETDTTSMSLAQLSVHCERHNIDLRYRWAWCNPPYGRSGIGKWGQPLSEIVPNIVALIPASVGALWFQQFWNTADAIVLVSKRLVFDGAPSTAQFDSALYIRGGLLSLRQLAQLSKIGTVIQKPGIIPWSGKAAWDHAVNQGSMMQDT